MFQKHIAKLEKAISAKLLNFDLEKSFLTVFFPSLRHWRRQLTKECCTEFEQKTAKLCILSRNNIKKDFMDYRKYLLTFDFKSPNSLRWFISLLDTISDDAASDRNFRLAAHHLVCVLNNLKVNKNLTYQSEALFFGLTTAIIGGDYFYNMCERYKNLWSGQSEEIDILIKKLEDLRKVLSKEEAMKLKV